MSYKKPTTLWSGKVKYTKQLLNKNYLTKKDKEYINSILDNSNAHMEELNDIVWKLLSARQSAEMILKLATPYINQKEIKDIKDVSMKIKKADKGNMWNSWLCANGMLNLLLRQLEGKNQYDIYGDKIENIDE